MLFQDYRQFIELCDKSTLEDKVNIYEFYLNNFALENLNVWDPNAKLGDLQLMALTSWMSHKEATTKKVKIFVETEEIETLYIIVEKINSMVFINHNIISNDA